MAQLLLILTLPPLLLVLWLACWSTVAHWRLVRFHRREGIEPPSLGLVGYVGFYGRMLQAILLLCWWLVRARGRDGLRHPPGPETGRPVLCVHGFFMNGTSMWGLRRALEARGRTTRAVSLGRSHQPPDIYARSLAAAMREVCELDREDGFDVVAHSMGGLILRQVLSEEPELARAVRRIVTLGSPHQGTCFLNRFPVGKSISHLMRPDSAFLRDLDDFRATVPESTVMTMAALPDLVVYPTSSSHLPGARRVNFLGIGHSALIVHPRVTDIVVGAICDQPIGNLEPVPPLEIVV